MDIVDYLLHRYAGELGGADDVGASPQENVVPASTAKDAAAWSLDQAIEPDLPRLHGSARLAKAASLEGPDAERVRASLRDRLSSLNATNDARRATQPRIRPAPPYRPLFATLFLPPEKLQRVIRTTFPEDGWQPMHDQAEVESFDEASLTLFRQAIAYDQGWDLETAEALAEDEVMRLLLGEEFDTDAS